MFPIRHPIFVFPYDAPIMTDRETIQTGLDALVTFEAAAVTLLGVVRQRTLDGALEMGEDANTVLTAAQCQDEQHYHALIAAGGEPFTDAFTINDALLADRTFALVTILELKAIGIAGYMALSREWGRLGELDQLEISYQIGAVEAQHQSLAHALVGVTPANDRAFARWLFAEPAEAIEAMRRLDLIEGSGEKIRFPGPLDRLCRGIFGLTPETTAMMTLPRP